MLNQKNENTNPELWLPVAEYEGLYEVSSNGNLRSVDREVVTIRNGRKCSLRLKAKDHKTRVGAAGYVIVNLTKDGKKKTHSVHRLVASAFVPLAPGKSHVNHKDLNRTNNVDSNLEWTTQSENNKHARMGGKVKRTPDAIVKQVVKLRKEDELSFSAIAKLLSMDPTTVRRIAS